jgi:hypothetical protein
MYHIDELSTQEINTRLLRITADIRAREDALIADAGASTNSIIGGFANGSLTVMTENEMTEIYNLKQGLMSRTGEEMEAAKLRIIARRAARKEMRNAVALCC